MSRIGCLGVSLLHSEYPISSLPTPFEAVGDAMQVMCNFQKAFLLDYQCLASHQRPSRDLLPNQQLPRHCSQELLPMHKNTVDAFKYLVPRYEDIQRVGCGASVYTSTTIVLIAFPRATARSDDSHKGFQWRTISFSSGLILNCSLSSW